MKALTDHGLLLLGLGLGLDIGCADDSATTTPVEATSETEPGTTAAPETTSSGPGASTGTTGTETTAGEDPLAPWYGPWYSLYPQLLINEPMWWGNGGDGLAFTLFELRAGSATIQVTSCLWGPSKENYTIIYEYTTSVDEDGVVVLEPVGGEYEFPYSGETERLYIEPGADCSALVVREVRKGGEQHDLFWPSLVRGELCLEKCAEEQGLQGLISDCGTPVPWQCSE